MFWLRLWIVAWGLRSAVLGILEGLSLCALVLVGMASTLVPTARGYARPTFRNLFKIRLASVGAGRLCD